MALICETHNDNIGKIIGLFSQCNYTQLKRLCDLTRKLYNGVRSLIASITNTDIVRLVFLLEIGTKMYTLKILIER